MCQEPLANGWRKTSHHCETLRKYWAPFLTGRGERPKVGVPKEETQVNSYVHFDLDRRIPWLSVKSHTVNTKARWPQSSAGSTHTSTSAAITYFLSALIFKTLFYKILKPRHSLNSTVILVHSPPVSFVCKCCLQSYTEHIILHPVFLFCFVFLLYVYAMSRILCTPNSPTNIILNSCVLLLQGDTQVTSNFFLLQTRLQATAPTASPPPGFFLSGFPPLHRKWQ